MTEEKKLLPSMVQEVARDIDDVMLYLCNHKEKAVEGLFGKLAALEYQEQWLRRNNDEFWSHLDWDNRQRLIILARAHYGPYRVKD